MVKLSSFSIAYKTLGTTSGKTTKELSVSGYDYGGLVPEREPLVHGSKRSKEPTSRANPTYLIKPVQSNGSNSHIIHEERVHPTQQKDESVDRLAGEYIRNIRKRLGCGL